MHGQPVKHPLWLRDRSFLQQESDLWSPGDFYMGELQQSDCQECLESQRALASGWPGSGGWKGDEALGQAC